MSRIIYDLLRLDERTTMMRCDVVVLTPVKISQRYIPRLLWTPHITPISFSSPSLILLSLASFHLNVFRFLSLLIPFLYSSLTFVERTTPSLKVIYLLRLVGLLWTTSFESFSFSNSFILFPTFCLYFPLSLTLYSVLAHLRRSTELPSRNADFGQGLCRFF